MKNSIFFKFLAILLCAASLMGIVGGTAGALVLVEGDLYNKTVDEMIAQRVQNLAVESANQIASRYADQVLGGCPEEISRYSGSNQLSRNFTSYGYAILDGEGNELYSLNPELKDSTQTHTIPITGQYMHLVSTETDSQAMEAEARKRMDAYSNGLTDIDGNTVPAEGISINQVIFTDQDGHVLYEANCDGFTGSSSYFYRDYLLDNGVVDTFANTYHDHMGSHTGFLFYNVSGQLAYTSFLEEHENAFNTTVYGVLFFNSNQGFTFQLENPEGLGVLSNESGHLLFTSFAAKQEAVPAETVSETIPVTTPETAPEETSVQTEPVEETEETQYEEETEATEEYTEEYEEEYTDDSEEYTDESDDEDYEEEDEPSSASADPDEEGQDEENEDIDWERLDDEAEKRIVFEWLLSKNLIAEQDLPEDMLPDEYLHYWLVEYELIDPDQTIPEESVPEETVSEETIPEETIPEETVPEETIPEFTEPVLINGKPLETYQINRAEYVNHTTGEHTTAKYVYLPMPELTVEVYAGPEAMKDASSYDMLRVLRQYRGSLLPVIAVCLLLFALTAVYLYTAAGRKPNTAEVRAGGLNRIPLDLYLIAGTFIAAAFAALAVAGVPVLLKSDFLLGCSLAVTAAFVCCLIFTGFCFAFVAQIKTGGGFWWRNTLSVRFIFLFMRCAEKFRLWLAEKGLPFLLSFAKTAWQLIWKFLVRLYEAIEKITARTGEKLNRFFSLIPMTWQWLLGGFAIILFALLVNTHHILLILLGILVPIAIVLYATHCFGILSESTKRMGKGNLDTKVEDKLMVGCFRDFAKDLNELADVAMVAAQQQLKSERMKTELITNVSHDIKTPLTSIINYVDLLQKPHTEEEADQYLEVLDRQSQRLKKLVEDLMDMSKASTGNMAVEITRVDAVESVNQALGEFADKLERAQLYPVFRHSEASVPIMADGKLVWRVLSNLLSNTVKYAMPGTRIYLDLIHVNGKVIISLKNISREELNVNAEELMERFVRGDISRNTEGSGLGLNIAKSLMELQKGHLQLLVDGDLFKVTLIFPDAK